MEDKKFEKQPKKGNPVLQKAEGLIESSLRGLIKVFTIDVDVKGEIVVDGATLKIDKHFSTECHNGLEQHERAGIAVREVTEAVVEKELKLRLMNLLHAFSMDLQVEGTATLGQSAMNINFKLVC